MGSRFSAGSVSPVPPSPPCCRAAQPEAGGDRGEAVGRCLPSQLLHVAILPGAQHHLVRRQPAGEWPHAGPCWHTRPWDWEAGEWGGGVSRRLRNTRFAENCAAPPLPADPLSHIHMSQACRRGGAGRAAASSCTRITSLRGRSAGLAGGKGLRRGEEGRGVHEGQGGGALPLAAASCRHAACRPAIAPGRPATARPSPSPARRRCSKST